VSRQTKRGTRRIVDYVISLSGKAYGTPLMDNLDRRFRTPSRAHADKVCADANSYSSNPTARVLPVVRYELDREEERLRDAVVEAAMAEYEAACALSEAKRRYHEAAPCHAEEEARADAPCVAASTAYVAAYCARENAARALRAHMEKKG
jgi:hypothetical protein